MLARPRVGPWLAAVISLLATQGVSQSIPSPNIDFSQLGQVAVAGNFDAISVYSHSGQREGFNSNGTQSVLSQLSSGFYQKLASTDASIEAMCPFVLKNGTFVGVMVGGNFTSIAGVDTRSVALINPTTFEITPQVGIQGSVNALLCDQDTETVYVGGSFEASISTNAITWVAAGNWANLPFSGFDAPVSSIIKAPNGHIVFGGSFAGLGNSTTNSSSTSQSNQAINLATANIISVANTTSGSSITCPPNSTGSSNSPWLLRDNTPGSWQADLRYGFQPSKLRLWNTHQDGRGTRTFRLTALPDGGIMNFTYTDPATGRLTACDATCTLSNNASVEYQDFTFVNRVGMNSVRIDVSQWYGSGGGLAGVQLFQSDIFSYAVPAFNEPACAGSSTPSNATATGAWRVTPSGNSNADYLTVVTGPATVGSAQIVFEPDVKQSGNYSVIVYTPGCLQDSSCSARAIVNVTGSLTASGGTTFNSMLYQTNNFDKYDQVYQGRIEAATSAFRPRVTIRPSGQQADQLVVASRIRFGLISSTGGLNGLFEYDPNQAVVNTDFDQSAINSAGNKLQENAHIMALTTHDSTIYAAGQFTDDAFQNIMSFSNNQISSLPQSGLNAAVTTMYSDSQYLYCGGNFTQTNGQNGPSGLNNVAAYQFSNNQWLALGNGVDGRVDDISPMPMNVTSNRSETVIAVSGNFKNILGSGSNSSTPANGFAIWVPSRNAWLETINNVTKQALVGQLFAYTNLPNGTWLGAGTLTSLGQSINDAASLQSASSGSVHIQQFPVQIASSSSSSTTSRKRDLSDQQNITGVATGLYYTANNGARNVTVLGGHFTATGSNSAVINNLLFLNYSNNNAVTGLPQGIDNNSTFLALASQNDVLVAGGRVSGSIGSSRIGGIVMYDLSTSAYRSIQPAALVGDDVIIKSIATRPSSSMVYVGGSFDSTSQGLACRGVCMYDLSSNQWNVVGGQLGGFVVALYWVSDTQLVAAGNLTVSGNSTSLALYDPKQQTWSAKQSSAIPGTVSAFAPGSNDGKRMWMAGTATNGSTFLMEADGDTYRPVVGYFGTGTNIIGLQIMPLTSNHGKTDFMDNDQALLVTGQLNITGYGQASSALFNGTSMRPFILASTSTGNSGSVSQIFSSKGSALKSSGPRHSRGITILVALCAALGTIFLIILCGILLNYIQRRRAGYHNVPTMPYTDKHTNINRVPPESLFGTLGQRQGAAPMV